MTETSKKLVYGSMVAAIIVTLMSISDLVSGIPFSGVLTKPMDIVFIICSALLGYLCWNCLKDAAR